MVLLDQLSRSVDISFLTIISVVVGSCRQLLQKSIEMDGWKNTKNQIKSLLLKSIILVYLGLS
jgi:hypothetical protein